MGYVHDTQMSQYLPPSVFHYVTGTWTQTAGAVADTIAWHRAANDQTAVINVPVMIPSNAAGYKGAQLKSIEFDYDLLVGAVTSVTPVLNKVTRGAEGAVAVVTTPAITYTPLADVGAATVNKHKMVVTLTTPEWIDNDVYFLLEITIVAGANGNTTNILGAVVNYTLRV